MTTWRRLMNPQLGSWPLNDEILADWDAGRAWRDEDPANRKLELVVRLELVGAGSRGEVDLDEFGPWNARQVSEFGRRWDGWEEAGYRLLFNLPWTQDPRLLTVPRWLGYWNIDRDPTRKYVQVQSFVMDLMYPDYRRWVAPRVRRAFDTSGADTLQVPIKADRFEKPTNRLSVLGGVLNTFAGAVETTFVSPDIVTSTATTGFRTGMQAMLLEVGLPFRTALQPVLPPGKVLTRAEYEAVCREWLGEELAPEGGGGLWVGSAT